MELREEWNHLLKSEEEIYIYGAGKYGKIIYKLLKRNGKEQNVSGFLVSDPHDNPEMIEAQPVYAISSIENKEALILIAVSDQYQDEIASTLEKLQFHHVVNAYKYAFLDGDDGENRVDIADVHKLLQLQYTDGKFCRYDIAVRLLAIEEYFGKNTFGMSLYRKMQKQRVRPNYDEISEERFARLIMSWEKNGYDPDSEIIVDENFRLIDGAHRLALAIYYELSYIKVRVIDSKGTTGFGEDWFREYFEEEECRKIIDRLNQIMADYGSSRKDSAEKLKEKIYLHLGKNQDFGKGGFYQSLEELHIEGQRPTEKRIDIYGLKSIAKDKRVLDIGCNCGFLDLSLSPIAKSVKGVEYNRTLVKIAETVKDYLKRENVCFEAGDFKEYAASEKYDVIFSFAVHYWIGLPIKDYCEKIASMLETDGHLVFESQNIETVDTEFVKYCSEFEKLGLEKIREDEICDDGKIARKFLIYKNSL